MVGGVVVVVEAALDAPKGQIVSGGGTGADHGTVCNGTVFGAGVLTAAGDVRAESVDEELGWRTGLGAGVDVVGEGPGK